MLSRRRREAFSARHFLPPPGAHANRIRHQTETVDRFDACVMVGLGGNRETMMRVSVLMATGLMAMAALMLAACETAVAPAVVVVEKPLPDYRPETAAACNSVGLSVTYAQGGAITVNAPPATWMA